MYKGILLKQDEVLTHWILLEPYIERFLDRGNGESTTFDIGQKAINGLYQVWVIQDNTDNIVGVSVTKVDTYPQHKALHIIGLSGELWDEWKHLHNTCFEPFAKVQGCSEISIWGRKAWTKKLKELTGTNGETYKERHVIMTMKLKQENQHD
jgi:hypothetical protein